MKLLTEKISDKIPEISEPQFKFMTVLFAAVLCLRGKMDFRNMSRYGDLSGKTFSRNFRKNSGFLLNRPVIEEVINTPAGKFAATDCTSVPESGDSACGPGCFRNGSAGKTEKGPGLPVTAVGDADCKTAYNTNSLSKNGFMMRKTASLKFRTPEKPGY